MLLYLIRIKEQFKFSKTYLISLANVHFKKFET